MLILVKLLTKNVIFYNALKRSASNRSRSNVDPKLTCDQAVLLLPFLGDEGQGPRPPTFALSRAEPFQIETVAEVFMYLIQCIRVGS